MIVIDRLIRLGHPNRPGFAIAPRGMVWHRTGRDVGALWLGDYFDRDDWQRIRDTNTYGSSQYGIDDDYVVRYIPDNEGAYHAASARPENTYSRNGVDLGVELCQYFDDPPRIRPKTYANAVAFAAAKCIEYGWSSPREVDVLGPRFTRHQDWDPIDRPNDTGDFLRWDDFLNDVDVAIAGTPWVPKEDRMTDEQLKTILWKLEDVADSALIYVERHARGLDPLSGQPYDPVANGVDPAGAILAARAASRQ